MDSSSRRGFLRHAVGQAAKVTSQLLPVAVRPQVEPEDTQRSKSTLETTAAASPPSRFVSVGELVEIAVAVGLENHRADIRKLARVSLRLTPVSSARMGLGTGHQIWDIYAPSAIGRRPEEESRALTGVAKIDLALLSAAGVRTELPARGAMSFFFDETPASAMGSGPVDCGLAQVILFAGPGTVTSAQAESAGGPMSTPAALTPELSLPRVWALPVQGLGLTEAECTAWERMRSELAERQEAELFDRSAAKLAIHRVLGYPDERGGLMAERCEGLASSAVSDELDANSWRLLLQVTVLGHTAFSSWAPPRERIYFWIADAALRRGDFSEVRVFAQ
jgi:Domain of unknown function (DUF1963)